MVVQEWLLAALTNYVYPGNNHAANRGRSCEGEPPRIAKHGCEGSNSVDANGGAFEICSSISAGSEMETPAEINQRADLRDYPAAKRAFLASIPTGPALMGFGFVVARFGLFLQHLQVIQHALSAHPYELSLWLATALTAVGVVVNLRSFPGKPSRQWTMVKWLKCARAIGSMLRPVTTSG